MIGAQINLEKIPDANTKEMIGLIHSILEAVMAQLPFSFTAGDVMSAATALLIDAGMLSVMEGLQTKEELADEICAAIRSAIEQWNPKHSKVTSDVLQNRTTQ